MVKRARTIAVASVGLAAVTAFMVAAATRRARPSGVLVELDTGRIEGVVEDDVIAFKGVPFAAPPVGELRWRPPKPHPAARGRGGGDRAPGLQPRRQRGRAAADERRLPDAQRLDAGDARSTAAGHGL